MKVEERPIETQNLVVESGSDGDPDEVGQHEESGHLAAVGKGDEAGQDQSPHHTEVVKSLVNTNLC